MIENIYTGYREIVFNDDELASLYANDAEGYELPGLLENEYALIKNNDGEIIDKLIYQNGKIRFIKWPVINDHYGNRICARNEYQNFAIDLLQDRRSKVKLLRGVYGSGKLFATV